MSAPNSYQTSVLVSFSTFLDRSRAADGDKQAATELLKGFVAWKSQEQTLETWNQDEVDVFLEQTTNGQLTGSFAHHTQNQNATELLKQFIQRHPPYQISVFLQRYLLALKADGCSASTIRNYRSDINQFWQFSNKHQLNQALVKPVIATFVRHERQKGLQTSSIRRKLASLSQFGLWAQRQGLVAGVSWLHNPQLLEELEQNLSNTREAAFIVPAVKKPVISSVPAVSTPTQPPIPLPKKQPITAQRFQERRAQIKSQLDTLSSRVKNQTRALIAPYVTLALVVLFFLGVGVFGYQQLIQDTPSPLAFPSVPTPPNRILSFQGRLTDTAQNPITAATDFQFRLYDTGPGTGGTLLWDSGTCAVTPDQDGIFSVGLGANPCGTAITEDVFSENTNVWLEVQVEAETLTPRQPIRTVPYALNSETLQGYPINASGAATRNTVLTMNDLGQVVLGEIGPEIYSVSGQFAITGQSLLLQTENDGDIILDADGTGGIFLNNDTTVTGGLQLDGDLTTSLTTFNLLNTTATTINFGGAATTISIGAGTGTTTINNDLVAAGTITSPTLNTPGGIIYAGSGGTLAVSAAGTSGDCLLSGGAGTPTFGSCAGAVSSSILWQQVLGTAQLKNTTLDLIVGGTSTASAKFAVLNVNGTGPVTATVSGNLIVMPTNGAGGRVGIGTTNPGAKLETLVSSGGVGIITTPSDTNTYTGLRVVGNTNAVTYNLISAYGNNSNRQTNLTYSFGGSNRSVWGFTNSAGTNEVEIGLYDPAGGGSQTTLAVKSEFLGTGTSTYTGLRIAPVINQTSTGVSRGIHIQPTLTAAPEWRGIDIANNSGYGIYQSGTSAQNYFAGKVGIGTTTPTDKLEVIANDGNQVAIKLQNTSTNGITYRLMSTGASASVGAGNFAIYDNDNFAYRLLINNAGNVGIGSTSPGAKLDVAGTFRASGNVTFSNFTTDGGLLYTNASGVLAQTATGAANDCLLSSGGGAPTWGSCSGAVSGSILWQQVAGTAQLKNSTLDLLVGGTSTASAKFAVTGINSGTPTATIAGTTSGAATYITGEGTIATTNNRSLAINPAGGNVGIGTTNASEKLQVQGRSFLNGVVGVGQSPSTSWNVNYGVVQVNNAALWSQNSAIDTLLTSNSYFNGSNYVAQITGASSRFRLTSSGGFTFGTAPSVTAGNNLTFTDHLTMTNSGNVGIGTTGPSNILHVVTTTNSGPRFDFSSASTGVASNSNLELRNTNATVNNYSSLISRNSGGGFGSSIEFINRAHGSNAASIGDIRFVTNNLGTITEKMRVTAEGNIGIGSTTPGATLDIVGTLRASGQVTFSNYTTDGGIFYANGSGLLAQTTAGGAGECLVSNGGGAPTWSSCAAAGGNLWRLASGAISPINDTVDLLIGSSATASAKFAVLNVNTGTPVASVSSGTSGTAAFLTADGTLSTANRMNLTLGNSSTYNTTGNVLINPNGTGNVGIGTTTPGAKLDISIPDSDSSTLGLRILDPAAAGSITFRDATNNAATFEPIITGNVGGSSSRSFILQGNGSADAGSTPITVFRSTAANAAATTRPLFQWQNNTTPQMTMLADGNLGIGTTSPSGKLHIKNTSGGVTNSIISLDTTINANASGALELWRGAGGTGTQISRLSMAGYAGNYITGAAAGDTILSTSNGTNTLFGNSATGAEYMRINSTGNVGIGTTNPQDRLSVQVSTNGPVAQFRSSGSGDTHMLRISVNTSVSGGALDNYVTFNSSGDNLGGFTFGSSSNEFLRITSAGDVGIGSTSPGAKLDIVGTLRASGAVTFSNYTTDGGIFYANGSGLLAQTTAGGAGECLVSNGGGAPTWSSCAAAGGQLWRLASGAISPINDTVDLLIGSSATASAKFAVLNVNTGTPVASVSSGTSGTAAFLTADGTLSTANRMNLTLGNSSTYNTTGNVLINPNGTGNVGIGTTSPTSYLQVGSFSAPFTSAGINLASFMKNNSDTAFPNIQVFNSGSGDASMLFNVSGSTFTLGIDQSDAGKFKISRNADLATSNVLTINTSNQVGIGTTAPSATLDVNGDVWANNGANRLTSTGFTRIGGANHYLAPSGANLELGGASGSGLAFEVDGGTRVVTITTTGNVGIGSITPGTTLDIVGTLRASGAVTFSNYTTDGGIFYANGSGLLAQTTAGSANECLISNGGGAPTWGNCATAAESLIHWTVANGALFPKNSTLDFFIGGQATDSAKFAVLNVNGTGPATASVSGNLIVMPHNGAGGNVGIGTTSPASRLNLNGSSFTLVANGLTWGDGDTGIYEDSANSLGFTFGGTKHAQIYAFGIRGEDAGDPMIRWTAQNPTNAPIYTFRGDEDTGMTQASADNLSFLTNGSEKVRITSTGNIGIGTTNPIGKFQVTGAPGAGGNALAIFNQTNADDILTASASGTTRLRLSNAGGLYLSALNTAGGVVYTDADGQLLTSAAGTTGDCLLSGGAGAPTFGSCAGAVADSILWHQVLGTAQLKNTTLDLIVGGTSTASAKFAVLNVNTGTPVASISANSGAIATYLTGDGTLATTNRNNLTIGNSSTYNTTGNVLINPNGTGNVGIGTTTPGYSLDVNGVINAGSGLRGSSGNLFLGLSGTQNAIANLTNSQTALTLTQNGAGAVGGALTINTNAASPGLLLLGAASQSADYLQVRSNGGSGGNIFTINSSGNVGIGSTTPGAKLDIVGTLRASGAVTFSNYTTDGGIFYANGSGLLAQTTAGGAGECLVSNGGGAPTWSSCAAAGGQLWRLASGAISPINDTVDLLIGSSATASAKFAVLNVNTGTPVASISANSGALATYLTGDGTLATTNRNNLTLGNSSTYNTTGNILLNPNGTGNVGIGTTDPTTRLHVEVSGFNTALRLSNSTNAARYLTLTATQDNANINTDTRLNLAIAGTTEWRISATTLESRDGGVILNSPGSTSSPAYSFVADQNSGLYYAGTDDNIGLVTGGTERLRINASGNVGIGTTSPASRLHVNVGTNQNILFQSSSSEATIASINDAGSAHTALRFIANGYNFYQAGSAASTMTLLNSGNVGIGTTAPGGTLDISNNNPSLRITDANATTQTEVAALIDWWQGTTGRVGYIGYSSTGNSTLEIANQIASGNIVLSPGNSPKATFTSGGNVGIGSTSPGALLDVAGTLRASGAVTFSNYTTDGGIFYANGSGLLAQTTAGGAGECLVSNGGGAPTWSSCAAAGGNLWRLASGAISPINDTVDMLIGSSATTSAKFAFLNVNSGIPTASIAGTTTDAATYITGEGTIATTLNRPLLLNPTGGNVSIGTTASTSRLHVEGNFGSGQATAFIRNLGSGEVLRLRGTGGEGWVRMLRESDGIELARMYNVTINSVANNLGLTGSSGTGLGGGGTISLWARSTQVLLNQLGSEGTPSLSFTADTNTGLFSSGGDTLNLTTGGTERVRITSTGNVGIGTTAPAVKLHVFDATSPIFRIGSTTTDYTQLSKGTGSTLLRDITATGNSLIDIDPMPSDGTGNAQFRFFRNTNTTGTVSLAMYLGNNTATIQHFFNSNGNSYVNASTGNFGIGSTSPGAKLDVTGTLRASGAVTFSNYTTDGGIFYANGSGLLAQTTAGTLGECLVSSGGGAPTWGACGSGGDNFWTIANGSIYPINETLDFFIGGTSTASAKFAVLNVDSGTPTASVSAGATGAAYLTAAGDLQTTARQDLNIGGDTTGNVSVLNTAGTGFVRFDTTNSRVGIGTTAPAGLLSVGSGSQFQVDSSGNIVTSGDAAINGGDITTTATTFNLLNTNATTINFGGAGTTIGIGSTAGTTTINNNLTAAGSTVTFSNYTTDGGLLYTNGSGVIAQTTAGAAGECLTSNGGGAPTWASCAAAGGNLWRLALGAISPINDTLDLLVGSNATASAKFGFLNVNSGTPVASISANSGAIATYLTGDGTLATTNRNNLTIGNSSTYNTTGNILLNPNGTGRVGINLTTPTHPLHVAGSARVGNVVLSESTTTSVLQVSHNGGSSGIIRVANNDGDLLLAGDNLSTGGRIAIYGRNQAGGTGIELIGGFAGSDIAVRNLTITGSGAAPTATVNQHGADVVINGGPSATGGGTDGDVILASLRGNVGIGTTAPTALLSVGATSQFQVDASGNITTSGDAAINGGDITTTATTFNLLNTNATTINFGGAGTTIGIGSTAGTTTINNNLTVAGSTITFSTFTTDGGLLYTNGSGVLAQTAAGTAGQCLGGGATPTWVTCTSIGSHWRINAGAISPINDTLDLLIGSNATESAKFAFMNVDDGTPTASISANANDVATFLTGDGFLSTTSRQALTIGNSSTYNTTGNTLINPNGVGSVGIGTTAPIYPLDLLSSTTDIGGRFRLTTTSGINIALSASSTGVGAVGNQGASFLASGATTNYGLTGSATGGTGSNIGARFTANNGTTNRAIEILADAGASNYAIYSQATAQSYFAGNIGIGTTTINAPLHVEGAYSSNAAAIINQLNSGDILTASASGTTRLRLTNGGQLLAGSGSNTAPTFSFLTDDNTGLYNSAGDEISLSIGGTQSFVFNSSAFRGVLGSAGTPGISFTGDTNTGIFGSGSDVLGFSTGGTERLRIGDIGRIGIGTTTLTGGVNISLNSGNNAGLIVNELGGGDLITASASGTTRFRVGNDGYVHAQRFVDLADPAFYLDPAATGDSLIIAGDITLDGGGTIQSTGDNDINIDAGAGTVSIGGGTGKLDAGAIDPPYWIDGVGYATFAPSMIGIKEEVTRVVALQPSSVPGLYKYEIDFPNLTSSSDLDMWLFTRISDFGPAMRDLAVLVSANGDARVNYKKDTAANKLIIFSDKPVEVSLRLTSPRFDSSKYPTIRPNQDGRGFRPTAQVFNVTSGGTSDQDLAAAVGQSQTWTLSGLGTLNVNGSEPGQISITQSNGTQITKADAMLGAVIGQLRSGFIETRRLVAERINAAEGEFGRLRANQRVQTPRVETDLISPFAGNDLTLQANNVRVRNQQNQTVAQIDAAGNAEFQGNVKSKGLLADLVNTQQLNAGTVSAQQVNTATISAQNAAIAQADITSARIQALEAHMADLETIRAQTADIVTATISGTLYADDIYAFEDKVSSALQAPSLLAQILGQVPQSSSSASLDVLYQVVDIDPITASGAGSLKRSLADLGLGSEDITLGASAAFINQYFQVNGSAYIADSLGVQNTLLLGSGTRLSEGELEYIFASDPASSVLKLQPSGVGSIELLAGVMTITQDGSVSINGDLNVAGSVKADTLLSNLLAPADFGNPFQVQVAGASTESGQVQESRFEIINELGTPVATISAQGRADFAAGIGVGTQDLGDSQDASANQPSGRATVTAGNNQVVINSNLITEKSLVYVTPVGSTGNQVLYVKSQTTHSGETQGQFVVGFDSATENNVQFNWWIVN